MKRNIFLLVMLLSIIQIGCSIQTQLYLRNRTDQPKIVKALLIRNNDGEKYMYKEGILNPKFNLKESFNNELIPTDKSNQYYYFNIPANSTCYLGQGLNYRFSIKKLYIEQNNLVDTLSTENLEKFNVKKRIVWHDIK